tara:strand:+ start:69012 stop:70754 length:1743 start_codon:yes stop_codon:yes gene_type:complete
MIDNLSFINNHWFWHVVFTALFLWLVFAWKEWQQVNKSRRYLKLILALIALTSLSLIILKPMVVSKLDTYEMVLLTKGYHVEKLDSIKNEHKKIQVQNYKANRSFINPNKKPSSIYVLGEGIAAFDFYQLDSLNVTYLGRNTPSGVVKLNYEQKQTVGNSIAVQGLYTQPKKGTKLILESAAETSLDSVMFPNDSAQIFNLSTQLNVVGNYEYHLVEKDSLDRVIASNPIGIRVVPERTLSVFIVNWFPTFETKYLKNFLAEKGHEVIVRSQVTRGKFKYEYFNRSTTPSVDFSEKSLQNFDMVIMDAQSFKNLSRRQKNNLEATVRNEGLGLFIQTSNFNSSVNYLTDFGFQLDKNTTTNLSNYPKIHISKYPYRIKPQFSLHPIHQINNSVQSAYKPLGNGQIGIAVFENTFQLILNGHSNVYQSLWTEIINVLSKKHLPLASWNANSNIHFKDQPFNFSVRSHSKNPIVLNEHNQIIPLINSIDNNSLWFGTVYPKNTGWQQQHLQQDSTAVFNYYVTDTLNWKALQSYQTSNANKKQFKQKQTTGKPHTTRQALSLIWMYMLFLFSISYLWLEPKL